MGIVQILYLSIIQSKKITHFDHGLSLRKLNFCLFYQMIQVLFSKATAIVNFSFFCSLVAISLIMAPALLYIGR